MIIIEIPRALGVFPAVLRLEKETLLLEIVQCIPDSLGTLIDH